MALYWTVHTEKYEAEDGEVDEALVFAVHDDVSGATHVTMTDFEEILDHADDPEILGEMTDLLAVDPTRFQLPLIDEELRLLDWLAAHLSSSEEALDVLAAWRWSSPWNDLMATFQVDHSQIRAIRKVDHLPAVGRVQLEGSQVRAVAINALPSPAEGHDLLRVVILDEAEDEDPYGEEILLLPFSVLHIDERSFLPESGHRPAPAGRTRRDPE